jgi:hypothetical protein
VTVINGMHKTTHLHEHTKSEADPDVGWHISLCCCFKLGIHVTEILKALMNFGNLHFLQVYVRWHKKALIGTAARKGDSQISCIDIEITLIWQASLNQLPHFSANGGGGEKCGKKSCWKAGHLALVSAYFGHKLNLSCSKQAQISILCYCFKLLMPQKHWITWGILKKIVVCSVKSSGYLESGIAMY